jgi:hypothetical protein
MATVSMKFRKGMNRAAWFLLLFSWLLAAVVLGFEGYGQLQGAADGGLYSFALVLAVLGLVLFFAVRGFAWAISAFWEG